MGSFGKEVDEIWPSLEGGFESLSDFGRKLLKQCKSVQKPDNNKRNVDVHEFIGTSREFPLKFGVNSCRVTSQPAARHGHIAKQIASVYPVIHERTLLLYLNYLEHKCQWGNEVELPVYQSLSLCGFIQRLLEKRCASFFARNDKYLLLTGETGASGFEPIGSLQEKAPLKLEHVLSYDDIKMSALLSVSSYTEFINEGERANCGRIQRDRRLLEPEGVVMGLIGARLSRRNLMEFQEIVIARSQNTSEAGYGLDLAKPVETKAQSYRRLWRQFYETRDFKHGEVTIDSQRFGVSKNKQDVFDNLVMKRRYAISFDTLLLEAQARAKAMDKLAYIHVVGFGLGVWRANAQQEQIFLETFEQRIRELGRRLSHIGVVHFSWFHLNRCGGLHNGAILKIPKHTADGIRILISKRNPATKLSLPEHENMLLFVTYAWDGNALPGNEFWMNLLKSTGDSSTACHTLIAELHNPHINRVYCNGHNLHIASPTMGVLHIADYAKRVLHESKKAEKDKKAKE
ncbi:uncharacterized protein [Drosophila tropicalis]|uniref:uncharacterized protein n=1 Tax=Drosophila tropicalis TaxID=46794 RepID=UPI0035ABB808